MEHALPKLVLVLNIFGRYTKRPVIAETRIYTSINYNWKINEVYQLNVSERWVVIKFKDYAVGGKTSVKKMGLFTFIKYLIQHIPDKYFRLVRGYGLFSNCIKGKYLKKVLKLFKKRKQRRKKLPYLNYNWTSTKLKTENMES